MQLLGTGFNSAIRRQQVTVSPTDANKVHALRISVTRGPITLRVGTTAGDDDYVSETSLSTGVHSITLTPASNFFIQFSSRLNYPVLLNSVVIEASGIMELPTPWTEDDLPLVRYDQSGDVIFAACKGKQQQRIERRSNGSWSVVNYETQDGPFMVENVSGIRLTPSGISGSITLSSSSQLFRSGHVGALFRLTSTGQTVQSVLSGPDQFTDFIKVTGIGNNRSFNISKIQQGPGPWVGTLTLQRSVSEPGAWVDVQTYSVSSGSESYNDGLDNSTIYYRIGFKTLDYTSGIISTSLTFAGGSRQGVVRITGITSSTSAQAVVLSALGGTGGTEVWSEGD